MADAEPKDYWKLLIVGGSGRGKSMALRKLNPETTAFLNPENKPLPFPNHFKYYEKIRESQDLFTLVRKYGVQKEIEVIVVDSFTAWLDLLLYEVRQTKSGFDIWSEYAKKIGEMLRMMNRCPKDFILTAHDEPVAVEGGETERRTKVKGKEWEGLIESQFTIVLWAERTYDAQKKANYHLWLNKPGNASKCPPGIFPPDMQQIPNDAQAVMEAIRAFANQGKEVNV